MKRNIVLTTLVIIFAVMFAATVASTPRKTLRTTVQAEDAEGAACSFARAAGMYGFSDSGTVVGVGARVATGILTLDAAGNLLNGKATSSLNGTIADEVFSGTYTVNSNCTGTLAVTVRDPSGNLLLTIKADLAWDDNMRELRFIFTSAKLPDGTALQTVINGNGRKMGE